MDESINLYEVIRSGDDAKLTELLPFSESYKNYFYDYLDAAFETGNIKIIEVTFKMCPYEKPRLDAFMLCKVPYLNHNEDKKLEILKFLLAQDDLPFEAHFAVILCACTEKNFALVEFFFNKYYSEEQSLYPLIKKLEAAVDEWQHIGVLLHDEIDYLYFFKNHNRDSHNDFETLKDDLIENVAATFGKLLAKDTRDSLALAVELLQALMNKNLSRILVPDREVELPLPKIEQALKDPSFMRNLFQLIYNSINAEIQEEIYLLMMIGYNRFLSLFSLFQQFMGPFICHPLYKLVLTESECGDIQTSSKTKGDFSLKKLSRNVIRCKIFENSSNVKDFMDRIWEFNLPTTVKCFMLYIPDASWMNNLQKS